MQYLIILPVALFLFLASPILNADLVWSKEEGWKAEGGLAERFLGESLSVRNGVEAMNAAREAQERGDYRQALSLYKKVYKEYEGSVLAPEALYQSGIILKSRNEFSDAFKQFQEIVTNYPEYPKFNQVIEEQFSIASMLQKGKRPYYWGVIPGFKDYSSAIKYFESIITNAPFTKYAPMALMNIAILAEEDGKHEDAIDALDRLINDYPQNELAPDAYLMLAKVYADLVRGPEYDQGYTREAIAAYEDFLILYPGHNRLQKAEEGLANMKNIEARSKLILGDFYYYYRNNPKAALVFYNAIITLDPNSKAAASAKKHIELINQGVEPPKTPADVVFGRYEQPTTPAYLQEAEIEDNYNEQFEGYEMEDFSAPEPEPVIEESKEEISQKTQKRSYRPRQ